MAARPASSRPPSAHTGRARAGRRLQRWRQSSRRREGKRGAPASLRRARQPALRVLLDIWECAESTGLDNNVLTPAPIPPFAAPPALSPPLGTSAAASNAPRTPPRAVSGVSRAPAAQSIDASLDPPPEAAAASSPTPKAAPSPRGLFCAEAALEARFGSPPEVAARAAKPEATPAILTGKPLLETRATSNIASTVTAAQLPARTAACGSASVALLSARPLLPAQPALTAAQSLQLQQHARLQQLQVAAAQSRPPAALVAVPAAGAPQLLARPKVTGQPTRLVGSHVGVPAAPPPAASAAVAAIAARPGGALLQGHALAEQKAAECALAALVATQRAQAAAAQMAAAQAAARAAAQAAGYRLG